MKYYHGAKRAYRGQQFYCAHLPLRISSVYPLIPSGRPCTTRDATRAIFRTRREAISAVAGRAFGCFDRLALLIHSLSPDRTVVAGPKLFSWVFRALIFFICALARPFAACQLVRRSVCVGVGGFSGCAFRSGCWGDGRWTLLFPS